MELVLDGSTNFGREASTLSGAGSSRSSTCCSSECPSSSAGASASFSRLSSSTADIASLSAFVQREPHQCLTADGWKLHIMHVFDPTAEASTTCSSCGFSSGSRRQHPVLLIPGLASSAEHTFDLLPEYSLANALVANGYDVWMADLRGGCGRRTDGRTGGRTDTVSGAVEWGAAI